jgi:hypothetical protein
MGLKDNLFSECQHQNASIRNAECEVATGGVAAVAAAAAPCTRVEDMYVYKGPLSRTLPSAPEIRTKEARKADAAEKNCIKRSGCQHFWSIQLSERICWSANG